MGANVSWANAEQTILHFEYMGEWTWDEVFQIIQKSQQMMDAVNHPIATIVDLTDGGELPINSVNYLKQVVSNRSLHANDSGITIFLNAKILTKAMLDVIALGDPKAAQFVTFTHADTLDDAINKATSELIVAK